MEATKITRYGDPETLKLGEHPMPRTRAGEVLIRVCVTGASRPDVFQQTGNYPVPPGASDVPRLEVAGETASGGLAHTGNRYGSKVDDRICALVRGGSYAGLYTTPLGQVLSVPAGLSNVETAALPGNYFTVWSNVFDRDLLRRGARGTDETLLAQSGSSGVGTTAIRTASALGYRIFVTAGSTDKCDTCVKLGATRTINYEAENFVEIVKTETGPGAGVVLGMADGSYVACKIVCTTDGNRIVLIILLDDVKVEVPLGDVLCRRLTLMGSTLRPCPVAFKAAVATNLYETV